MASPPPKKFLFNTRDFSDQGIEAQRKTVVNAPPPPPSFSEEQLENARREGHKRGYDEATKAHKDALELRATDVMSEISRQLAGMVTSEDVRQARYEHDALQLALVLLEQLYPVLQESLSGEQLIFDAQQLLAEARGHDNITLRVHPEMLDVLSQRFSNIEGVKMVSDGNINITDITLSWPHGGAQTIRAETYKMLQQLVLDTIEGGVHQNPAQPAAMIQVGDEQ